MSYYGFTITDKGRALVAKLLAGDVLRISKVMVGSGVVPEGQDMSSIENLVLPVAMGTSSKPAYEGGVVSMTVEYRSDLNGGLNNGFWLREFGVFAYDPDEGEVMIYYATLGDYPQWCAPYSTTGIDVRRFPITIAIGEDRGVVVEFSTELWMTAEDVYRYYETVLRPVILEDMDEKIRQHNISPSSHPDIRGLISALAARVTLLELQFNSNVTGNPFLVTFETLEGVQTTGNWNERAARMEF